MNQRKLIAAALVGSLALNLFLLGAVGRSWTEIQAPTLTPTPAPTVNHPTKGMRKAQHRGRHKESRRGPHGPEDLALMRRMVRVMGGREDPRVKAFRNETRPQMKKTRAELRAAGLKVRSALTQDPFDAEALDDALAKLREKSALAQKGAQRSVAALAGMLTTEERRKLRQIPPPPQKTHPSPPH